MALGIRGANPIWSEVDLQGNLFDDTFYLFVLENTIPYIPATVYHDPDLNVPWTQPIRFLANGTLPVDIYFEADVVYRLEFRQGNTQQAPLIYEVNNYVAGTGGSTPVDTVAFASSNQITNPQFVLMNLQNPVTITGTDPDPIQLAPGWTLSLAGTGSVTITQVPLNDSNINPSNAPFALQLTMSGWTADSVILRQRFQQNGMLWADKIVSSTITARLNGSPQTISATLVDSNNSVLGTVLPLTTVNEEWNEYTGYADLPTSTNPNTPPAAYIEYLLHMPSNIDIYVTSFQLVVQELPIEPSFEQDSVDRQIDHTYNRAYPIVPVGSIIDFGGFIVPQHYYLCDGSTKDRVRDWLLFNAITFTDTPTLTTGMNTFTVSSSDLLQFYIGMPIESAGFPSGTTITLIVEMTSTITVSNNATVTGATLVRYFAWGNGDGSTTFNVPNLLGFVTAGAGGTVLGASVINGVGLTGGSSTHTLTIPEMPAHTHPPPAGASAFRVQGAGGIDEASGSLETIAGATGSTGGGAPHSIVQPTALVKKIIRYQ
jgi:microcystin-dependent protein